MLLKLTLGNYYGVFWFVSRYSDWNSASRTAIGDFEPQGVEGTVSSSTGVGVCSCKSSFWTTLSVSKGTSPAPLEAALVFISVIVAWNAAWKMGEKKNSVFETWVIEHLVRCSISRPCAFLSTPKHPTSRLDDVCKPGMVLAWAYMPLYQ